MAKEVKNLWWSDWRKAFEKIERRKEQKKKKESKESKLNEVFLHPPLLPQLFIYLFIYFWEDRRKGSDQKNKVRIGGRWVGVMGYPEGLIIFLLLISLKLFHTSPLLIGETSVLSRVQRSGFVSMPSLRHGAWSTEHGARTDWNVTDWNFLFGSLTLPCGRGSTGRHMRGGRGGWVDSRMLCWVIIGGTNALARRTLKY